MKMNKERRNELKKAVALIDRARYIIDSVQCDEQEALDNLPENLQNSEKAERMEEYLEILDDVLDQIDDGVIDQLEFIIEGE